MDGRGTKIAVHAEGNITGLKPSELKALNRLGQRRYPPVEGYTIEQARELAALSRLLSRQIGLLIDRQGRPAKVLVGNASSLDIPALPSERTSTGRLRGLRFLHTHLGTEPLTREDLADLLFLRLDALSVLTVDEWGQPVHFQNAHLMPDGGESATRISELLPWDRTGADFTAETEALEDEFSRSALASEKTGETRERAVLVSVSIETRREQERRLQELEELARTADIDTVGRLIQRVAAVHPRHILGQSKLEELEVLAFHEQASLILFDGELTPAQMGALSDCTERRVMDRTQLILDIFARHAASREGKLQVEMAKLQYALPRLSGRGRSLDRLAGGIFGNKGRGETKLELEKRRIRERMTRLKKALEDVSRKRRHTRARRVRQGLPCVSLVGYTNAGKSTLLNALTHSEVPAENKLFATLDPTTRRLRLPKERDIVLADTVGFIRNLPDELKEAFRATLEEMEGSDLLIHVADASHPECEEQMHAVENILEEMELHTIPRITVLNKWDNVPQEERIRLLTEYPHAIPISAQTGWNLEKAVGEIEKKLKI